MTVALKINSPCQRSRGIDQPISIPIRAQVIGTVNVARRVEWNLTCSAKSALRIRSGSTAFGLESIAQPALSRDLFVELSPAIVAIECAGSETWDISLPSALNNPEGRYAARLFTKRPLKLGPFNERITLIPRDRSGNRLAGLDLIVDGEIVSDVIAEPRQICLGRQRVDCIVEDTVVVRSLTGRKINVKANCDPGTVLERVSVRPDGAIQYRIKQRVTSTGEQSIPFSFQLHDMDSNTSTILESSIHYFGID